VALWIDWLTIDAAGPDRLATFWTAALDYEEEYHSRPEEKEIEILLRPREGKPGMRLLLLRVDDPKRGKNRLHLDLRGDDRDAEVERLLALGATRVDIGQGEVSWVVLGDPEGNEFCILRNQPSHD
jgi:hypothetical protein